MKLADNTVTTQSSVQRESYQMGIDQENISHVIGMLINQYANPVLAVIREYSANALDAHRMAGQSKPIRVTLPSALSPTFTVEDWGIGLSADDIRRVYSQYGASTKRQSNEQIGGFGIGAKSAFAVADQFTVSAVKDGMRTSVIFTRTDEGGGVIPLSQKATDEPNGVRVSIPVCDRIEDYEVEAKNMFRYWQADDVEVAGCEIDHLLGGSEQIGNITIYKAPSITRYGYNYAGGGDVHIRMGGIAYALDCDNIRYVLGDAPDNLSQRLRNAARNAVIDVPIGSINLAPSREALVMDSKARESLSPILQAAPEQIGAHYNACIDQQPSMTEAIKARLAAGAEVKAFCPKATWQGQSVPLVPAVDYLGFCVASRRRYGAAKRVVIDSTLDTWSMDEDEKRPQIVLIDTKGEDIGSGGPLTGEREGENGSPIEHALFHSRSGAIRRFAKGFEAAYSYNADRGMALMIASEAANDPYVQAVGATTITLAEYQEIAKSQRTKRGSNGSGPRVSTVYYDDENGRSLTVEEIAAEKIVYFKRADSRLRRRYGASDILPHLRAKHMATGSIVIVLNNRQQSDVFLRRIREAGGANPVHMGVWYDKALKSAIASLSEAERTHMDIGQANALYSRIVAPWAEMKFAGLDANSEARQMMQTLYTHMQVKVDHNKINTLVKAAHERRYGAMPNMPKPAVTISELTQMMPLLDVVACGMRYSHAGQDFASMQPMLAAAVREAQMSLQDQKGLAEAA